MRPPSTPPPSYAITMQGAIDLAEARTLARTHGCDIPAALAELESRQLAEVHPVPYLRRRPWQD